LQLVDNLKSCLSAAFSFQPEHGAGSTSPSSPEERELWIESEIEKRALTSVQSVISKHIQWIASLATDSDEISMPSQETAEEVEESNVTQRPHRTRHASTFEEVMSLALALEDPSSVDYEDGETRR
jgi:hypothetical protein